MSEPRVEQAQLDEYVRLLSVDEVSAYEMIVKYPGIEQYIFIEYAQYYQTNLESK